MLKFLLLLPALYITHIAIAQDDKMYYDNEWVKCGHKHASYYRVCTMQDSIYKTDDYYLFDKLYRTGYRTSIKSESINYRTGHYVFYDSAGYKMREGDYENGKRTGVWKYYYKHSDALKTEDSLQNYVITHSFNYDSLSHKIIGESEYNIISRMPEKKWQYNDGDTTYTIRNVHGVAPGNTLSDMWYEENEFYKNGKIKRKSICENNKITSSQCYNKKGEQIVCDSIKKIAHEEHPPTSGFDLPKYLNDNMKYPYQAEKNNITGRVIVKFLIDEDGTISDVHVLRGIGGGCDEEAMRVVAAMPPWKPGMQDGIPVRVYFTLPIVFNLQ